MAAFETVYTCPDGTPFPVTWECEEDERGAWMRDDSHWPRPVAPLDAALWRLAEPGLARAYAEGGLTPPPEFSRIYAPQGHMYCDDRPFSADEMAQREIKVERLSDEYGGMLGAWEGFCLPRVKAACRLLQDADATTPFAVLADAAGYAFNMTQVAGGVAGLAFRRLAAFCTATLGGNGDVLTVGLTQGCANVTLDADQALWDLAHRARATPAVAEAILTADAASTLDALRAVDGGQEFIDAFDAFLSRYGLRTETWDVLSPTWQERPEIPLMLIRRMVADERPRPADALRAVEERRITLVQRTEERLPATTREQFRTLLAAAAPYVAVREDRALWQLTTVGCLRGALLRRGQALVDAGLLDCAEDVLFLLPSELEDPHGTDLREAAAHRRREWDLWAGRTPPARIGSGELPTAAYLPADEASQDGSLLRGMPASRGTVTARARVLHTLGDAARLQPGEVLVCPMTSPPWTSLFGIAAAVVTDSGGPLSHPAIAAREYGIPCVVGTRLATTTIPDGALVTVDGAQGTVSIEG